MIKASTMKKAISLVITLAIIMSTTLGFSEILSSTTITESKRNIHSDTNLWFLEESKKSDERLRYEQLLLENPIGHNLRDRFTELFGNIPDKYLQEHFDLIFDTPAEQVDQGLLQLLLLQIEPPMGINPNGLTEDDPFIDYLLDNQETLEKSFPAPPMLTELDETSDDSFDSHIERNSEEIDPPITGEDDEEIISHIEPRQSDTTVNENETDGLTENQQITQDGINDDTLQQDDSSQSLGSERDLYQENSEANDDIMSMPTRSNVTVAISVTSVSSTSITFNVEFNPAISQYNFVQWYDRPSTTWSTIRGYGSPSGTPAATNETITMTNLQPSTSYSIFVGAYDSSIGAWSTEQIYISTSSSGNNGGNIFGGTRLELVSTTAYSFTVKPTFPISGKSGNEIVVQTYGAHSIDTSYIKLCNNSGQNINYTISGLTPETPYTFTLYYFDANSILYQEVYTFTTSYAAPGLIDTVGQHVTLRVESQQYGLFSSGILPRIVAKTDSTYESLQNWLDVQSPYNGAQTTINADRSLHGTNIEGVSGNPIKWSSWCVPRAALRANYRDNDVVEVLLHELGHNFDSYKWSFEPEAITNLFMYYTVKKNGWTMVSGGFDNETYQGSSLKTYFKSFANRMLGHVNYDASIAVGNYSPYGLAYNLALIMDQIGYEPFSKAFRYMGALNPSDVPSSSIGKFNMFLTLLYNYSGLNVISMFTSNEIAVYEEKLGGVIQYIGITDDVEVKGKLIYRWYDDGKTNPSEISLKNHTVYIYDENAILPNSLLATTTTDSLGNFSAIIENDTGLFENGYDIYIEVAAENDYTSITDWTNDAVKTYISPVKEDTFVPVLDFGMINLSNESQDLDAAFNILHWITAANNYYYSKTAIRVPYIQVKNERDVNEGSYCVVYGEPFFISISDRINASRYTQDQFDCSVITHEFGHHIMRTRTEYPTGASGTHYFGAMCTDSNGNPNYSLAYTEGFASFFSAASRNNILHTNYYSDGSCYGADIENLEYFDANTPQQPVSPNADFYKNAAYELFNAGALFDLFDPDNDDDINAGYWPIDYIFASMPYIDSLSGFYTRYMNYYASGNEEAVWSVFNNNHVSFDTTLPNALISRISNNEYRLTYSDNVCVGKVELYMDNTNTLLFSNTQNIKSGIYDYTFNSPPNPGTLLILRVWDLQGLANHGLPDGRTDRFKEITLTVS